MTVSLMERPSTDSAHPGDRALEIIDSFRPVVHDRFAVRPLESEFLTLSQQLGGNALWIAAADDNITGAFKWRGAANALSTIVEASPNPEEEEVYAVTAGNHGRGMVAIARKLGVRTNIVVNTAAPLEKREGMRQLWPDPQLNVYVKGNSFDESLRWAQQNQLGTQVHPYDSPPVITGQGTLADDILNHMARRQQEVNHIVLPTGGGGLASGILQRLNELGRSDVIVHAVQAEGSDSLSRSLGHEKPVEATNPNQRYGGSAVRLVGSNVLTICNRYSDQLNILTVSDEQVDEIMNDYVTDFKERLINPQLYKPYEPTSLVALAGLKQVAGIQQGNIVVVGTGHNAPLEQQTARRMPRSRIMSGRVLR